MLRFMPTSNAVLPVETPARRDSQLLGRLAEVLERPTATLVCMMTPLFLMAMIFLSWAATLSARLSLTSACGWPKSQGSARNHWSLLNQRHRDANGQAGQAILVPEQAGLVQEHAPPEGKCTNCTYLRFLLPCGESRSELTRPGDPSYN